MKKSLIALAVAGAVSAPAFAATSNVDVYGVLNVSVSRFDSDIVGADKSTSVTSNSSRIGFKGNEDLGGGLAAIWQIETTVDLDERTGGGLASRNSFVGLKGDFGTVLVGTNDSPMKQLGRLVDNFGDTYADSRNILGASEAGGASTFDQRYRNTVAYVSPSFSGLSVSAAYSADTAASAAALDNNDQDAYSLNAVYNNGPLLLGAAYEKQNVSATQDQNMWRLVAGYSFGNAKLGALYEKSKNDTVGANERKAWGLFGNYAMGNVTLKANYLKADDSDAAADSGAKQYTLGVDYALSKRTTAYALYAKVKNDTNAGFGLGLGANVTDQTGANNTDPSVFGIGMKHSF